MKKFATGEKSKSGVLILYGLLSFHGCQNMMKVHEYVISFKNYFNGEFFSFLHRLQSSDWCGCCGASGGHNEACCNNCKNGYIVGKQSTVCLFFMIQRDSKKD